MLWDSRSSRHQLMGERAGGPRTSRRARSMALEFMGGHDIGLQINFEVVSGCKRRPGARPRLPEERFGC